jgi:hypothetical protein
VTYNESVAQLDSLLKLKKNWDSYESDPPNEQAMVNARCVLEYMKDNLEANRVVPVADGGVGVVWVSEFNKGHYAHIECSNDGTVTGVTHDRNVLETNDPAFMKFFWISDFNKDEGEPGVDRPDETDLQLTIQESLEYIRHYIWANHDTA